MGSGTFILVSLSSQRMKATAKAHPIQGVVKYHGLREPSGRYPYHDSISVCTAPSQTITTVEFDPDLDADQYVVDEARVTGRGADRIRDVVEYVRDRAGIDDRVRLESQNSFPTNVGLGSSSSGFAAAAMALVEACDLPLSRAEISTIARRGSTSAARSVTGGFSHLRGGVNDVDCRSERIPTDFESEVRVVVGLVPVYKETESAHEEAAQSHMFHARLAHVHSQIADVRDALYANEFDRVFSIAEHDSLSLAATTMTGPEGWVYWAPESLAIFTAVRSLREDGVPVYFSTDTGATVYVNTRVGSVDQVEAAVAKCGVETRVWEVGGPAEILDSEHALF